MTIHTDLPKEEPALAAIESGVDRAKYWCHVAHLEISDTRKAELLEAIWRIMSSFVDRAFGDDPTQLARIAGDKLDRERAPSARTKVGSDHTSHTNDDGDLAGVFRRCGEGE